ncbi:uncharacterized protein LOC127251057 [Andrographis paniculata]|uniref:uncharacterized protein LOC127251007 n=1 Tax=Andrographis paniculata TaxID=175694 RepID=UPI0021E95CA0|nr:uncharacterized protein LOC127251007 [Andrographis paniculata]XP_051130484.1 uncharacterized protein LOC127251007 [Andrographis paniculata]XP_051130486.1 uncharacterized protein LOC127251007 [Andrographis paniculata]XP_051130487.1 uncharacterized protein LOC127251007 [Andrographis paniculata]XP_051130568.1 uncharacterized protein LOC127251057 [Andrographis paniculata]
MAASAPLCFAIVFFACSLFLHGTIAVDVTCETLPLTQCSFAVSTSGKRCVLEGGGPVPICKTSEIVGDKFPGYIETDQCINACGLDRQAVGISTVALASPDFTARLCSPACYNSCPNIVDLYSNLAAGEGKSLATLCVGAAMPPSASTADPNARRSALGVGSAPTAAPLFP